VSQLASELTSRRPSRFQLARAGVLNVWQYDDQVFEFADGRLLLRGSNGAGKSKTLEMLLPFVLDGDKQRMTASGRHHTSLLWLMLDGYGGQNRAGYLWVEFARTAQDGQRETITCGVGVRASQSARTATSWYFTFPGQVGHDLRLEDEAGPLSRDRLRAALEAGVDGRSGRLFESPRAYKQHVGQLLFGLDPARYDELLRLLYWLRQPQVGEDIEPAKLAEQLAQALPQLDDDAVRAAGDTFDELSAFGEQLDRQRKGAEAVAVFAVAYADYARQVLRARGGAVVAAHRERTRRSAELARRRADVTAFVERLERAEGEQEEVSRRRGVDQARLQELERDPALANLQRLTSSKELARELSGAASAAEHGATVARSRAERLGARLRGDTQRLCADLARVADSALVLSAELSRCGVRAALPVPAVLQEPRLFVGSDSAAVPAAVPAAEVVLIDALTGHAEAAMLGRRGVGERLAAVRVVDAALGEYAKAAEARGAAERAAAEEEQRADEARCRRTEAQLRAERAEADYLGRLEAWLADSHAVELTLPTELSSDTVLTVARRARDAAAPALARYREAEAASAADRRAAETELATTTRRRDEVAAEQDPAPGAPGWSRDPRGPNDGVPLWRLVDFGPGLDAATMAGLEAALEASGLLDALVQPNGAVLDARRRDVVLPIGSRTGGVLGGPSLADLLVVDLPAQSPVTEDVVRAVLARIDWREPETITDGFADGNDQAAIGADGSWRLGPLTGRATKPAAQYVGASARTAERARRLAELDAAIDALRARRDAAAAAEDAAAGARIALQGWLDSAPSFTELITAWALLDERTDAAEQADWRASETERTAAAARAFETTRHREFIELAEAHNLPRDASGLAAHAERLRELDGSLARHAEATRPLADRLGRWTEDAAAWRADLAEAERTATDAVEARDRAETAAAAAAELEQTVGASVRDIQRRIDETKTQLDELARRGKEIEQQLRELHTSVGRAEQSATDASARLAEQEPALAREVAALASVADTPGLLASGADPELATDPTPAIELARGCQAGQSVPALVLGLARQFDAMPPPARAGTEMSVYAAWQDAASGPGADSDPRVVEVAGALTVVGRDESGEHPIGELADRLAAAVQRDAELLTERERRLFEEHILGDLGEALRSRRLEAQELVTEMNQLLAGVTTSQGIEVALRWRMRDDVSADARRAVELLGRPLGALLPDERSELRDALHRLIEASRAETPEDSYAEHLARALDYRRWFVFKVRYTRPESAGTWHDLHRRSPLSQGEQKVVCYLPLFAAAAAHFSSLAGAAPHSPRFVLLDDAFPKIDVRTHPLLFGLLVQLDLDFVITSERLWGDHSTVPSLAIYEALRDPNERGIAQYRHLWDGQRLHAVGT